MQEKEVMEAAVRAFEDWEFRVLEQESGIDEEEQDESTADKEKERGSKGEMEKEISCQQHAVNTAKVNNTAAPNVLNGFICVSCASGQCLPSQADVALTFTIQLPFYTDS